ncbi:PB1 domain-containing protein [Carex littledalei]|uniref:PB1 domain-containing protein n=1 Tax=Carex littledalei TaxID=544730 RepID=A0A833R2S7_9POAL|nr:PB1 domain-containing protein [Carex littledalei]
MVCLRLRGRKGRSNRGPTTALQQRHWLPDMAAINKNDPVISSSVVKTDTATDADKRVKFLCSYGGKILLHPSDGQLKYVGGETRVVCVPRSISFLDLNKKIEDSFKVRQIVIKYRIMSEDLDTLVSIRCNDDMVHMLDEYDRLMSLGSSATSAPRFLRLFLFRSPKSLSLSRPHNYLDAINDQQMDPTPTEHRVELPGTGRAASSRHQKPFQRVWSTPNLRGAHQAGGDVAGPSSRMQCGQVYRNPAQLMGHSHQQACGRCDTCRCGSACMPISVERPPIRVPSYQNLNLACQTGSVVSDRGRSNLAHSPRTIGNGMQNPMHNNLIHMQKPMHINLIPNSSSEQSLVSSCAGTFGSVGSLCDKHVPLEVGSTVYVQQPRSGTGTPVGRRSRASTPVSEGC